MKKEKIFAVCQFPFFDEILKFIVLRNYFYNVCTYVTDLISHNGCLEVAGHLLLPLVPVCDVTGDPQDARGWTSTEQEQDQSRIGVPRSGNRAQQ